MIKPFPASTTLRWLLFAVTAISLPLLVFYYFFAPLEPGTIRRSKQLSFVMKGLRVLAEMPVDAVKTKNVMPRLQIGRPDGGANSWRLGWAVTASLDTGAPPADGDWESAEYDFYDDMCYEHFHLAEREGIARQARFTRLMAVQDENSDYNQILEQGWRRVNKVAPDAILLVEVVNSKVHWMAPGDLVLDTMPKEVQPVGRLGIGSEFSRDGFLIGFVDGAVWHVSSSVPFATLEPLLTVEGARTADRDKLLGNYSREVLSPYDAFEDAAVK